MDYQWWRLWRRVLLAFVVAVTGMGMFNPFVDGQTSCSFPEDIRGNWTASRIGTVDFNETHISGRFLQCPPSKCPQEGLESWTCVENDGDRYIMRSAPVEDLGGDTYVFFCLYLYKVSTTKYIYYHGPNDINEGYNDYVKVQSDPNAPSTDSLCNLPSPLPTERYHLLVKEDSISSSHSYCPSDLLGNFVSSDPTSCNATMEVCGDQNSIQVTNSSISPDLFLSANGSVKCMYSLSDDAKGITYLTTYNEDEIKANGETGFVCVAIFKDDEQVSLTQQSGSCIGLESPNVTTPICAFNSTLYCPITCQFSSSLSGSWVSTRKGDVTISGDTMTGFEPKGVECNTTVCNNAPTTFQCYMKTGSKYLIRTEATSINSESVRIYTCLSFSEDTSTKYIYHHDHSTTHGTLEEYVVTLNAATPVDSITEVCEGLSSFDAPLYSVFMKSGTVSDSVITCPSELEKIYNVSSSHCEYTLGTCDTPSEIKLSSTSCSPLPFYSENGTVGCLYSTTSGDTTYLTVYNKDNAYTGGSTYMFSCMAYSLAAETTLSFSQTPYGCHKNQSPTNVSTDDGLTFVFESIGSCPTSDDFPWIYIVIALCCLLFLIILIVILWYCCCKRKRKGKRADEESIADDVSERSGSSTGSADGKKSPIKRLMDVFTVGKDKKGKARERELGRSKLKHKRGHRGDEESFDSGVTGEDESDVAGKSRRRRRRKRGRKRRRKRILEDGTEEYYTTDDDGYNENDSEYSEDFDSDDYYTDSDGSDSSQRKAHLSNKSKAHQLHIAKAWEKRKNDPGLVKSTGSPSKGRADGEPGVEGEYDPEVDMLPGQVVPIAGMLSRGSPMRSPLRGRDRQGSRMSSARTGIRHIASPTRAKPGIDQRLEEARERFFHNIPHLGLYLDYTDKRTQMEDEGFWDDQQANKTASELFHFNELDETLRNMEDGETEEKKSEVDNKRQANDQVSTHSSVSRPSTGTQQGQGNKSQETLSTGVEDNISRDDVNKNDNDNNTRPNSSIRGPVLTSALQGVTEGDKDTEKESVKTANREVQTNSDDEFENIVAESIADRDIQSPGPQEKVTFVGSANLMARFYSRLNQIRTAKADTDSSVTSSDTPSIEKTDKRRIRTALRRLLHDRLFPDIRPTSPVKPLPANGDATSIDLAASGTVTPFTTGTRSKVTVSQMSSNKEGQTDDKRLSTAGSKGRVLFVETSDLSAATATSGDKSIWTSASSRPTTLGYYRRHEGPVRKPHNISRLYQPSRSNTESSLALSTRDIILKDPDFIKSLKNQIGQYNERSAPPVSTIPPKRPNMSWTYNQPRLGPRTSTKVGFQQPGQGMSRAELEDRQLKKLLEELYQDKKYMDTLISTKEDNPTEEEVSKSLSEGREYLLERAAYWLEKGPLPPRPPTSELGFRLEREQSAVSARSVKTT